MRNIILVALALVALAGSLGSVAYQFSTGRVPVEAAQVEATPEATPGFEDRIMILDTELAEIQSETAEIRAMLEACHE